MKICDFSRSFVTFRRDWAARPGITQSQPSPYDLNSARIQLECRCEVTDLRGGSPVEYVLGASCKSERVGVPEGIWMDPNADFAPVFSREDFLLMKSWDRNDKGVMLYPPSLGVQPERHVGRVADAYEGLRIDVRLVEGRALETAEEIVRATPENRPLVARTEFGEEAGYRVVLEYPVKTMNGNERDWIYQTDTGPVILPDLSRPYDTFIERFRMAFAAFNAPDWAEFIVQVPTLLAEGISVNHYSETRRLKTKNTLIEIV
ncbi:MAG: hypothetical protein EXS64_11515 [Candidatus Latescibacteria bacterium]|nr:hypothetical protein [Candidatus Latescibacterota bacterium]